MKIGFSINKFYRSTLSRTEILQLLNRIESEKKFGGLRVDKFNINTSQTHFKIQRYSNGLDGFTLEKFPTIKGEFVGDEPTIVNIQINPSYFSILFFSIFVIIFIPTAIFVDKMIINGVYRTPTILDRLSFAAVGGVMPGLWCYFGYIRPIRKAKNWVIDKLELQPVENFGN